MVRSSLGRGITTLSILFFSTMGILAVGPASATSTWGTAQEVAASLNTQNNAYVNSVSCSSAGNCSAGGYYRDSAGTQAFVVEATTPVTPTTTIPRTVPTTVPVTPTTIPLTTTAPAITTSASLAATGTNLTLPLGLAAVFLGVGGVGILESWRRRRRA